jgi:hypothetical protein
LNAIPPTRTGEEHEQWTSALISTMLLGCAEPWKKLQFQWMLHGFLATLEDTGMTMTEVRPSCLFSPLADKCCEQLLDHTVLSPLDITLSSYNRQIKSVQDLEQLFIFDVTGGSCMTRAQVDAIMKSFKAALHHYLNGTGHVQGTGSKFVTAKEFHLRRQDTLFRAKITLRQLTDSWLLPVGDKPENKIIVRPSFSLKTHSLTVNLIPRFPLISNRF